MIGPTEEDWRAAGFKPVMRDGAWLDALAPDGPIDADPPPGPGYTLSTGAGLDGKLWYKWQKGEMRLFTIASAPPD